MDHPICRIALHQALIWTAAGSIGSLSASGCSFRNKFFRRGMINIAFFPLILFFHELVEQSGSLLSDRSSFLQKQESRKFDTE
jgi:hypothetical protein